MGVETLVLVAAAAAATGKLVEGVSAYRQSQYNAGVAKEAGRQARYDAGIEVQLGLEQSARQTAQGITIAATQGGGYDGSAMDVLQDLGRQQLSEARRIAQGSIDFARAKKAEAKQIRSAGKIQLLSSAIGAVGAFAGGMAGMPTAPPGGSAPPPSSPSTIMTELMRPRIPYGGRIGGSYSERPAYGPW